MGVHEDALARLQWSHDNNYLNDNEYQTALDQENGTQTNPFSQATRISAQQAANGITSLNPPSVGGSIQIAPGSNNEVGGERSARNNASIYYGSSQQMGADAQDYRDRIKSNLNKPSGLANRMTQAANSDISRANAKAGLKGIDTTAASIRERRSAMTSADQTQQGYDQQNLANYGKSIGAGISGTEALAAAGRGQALAGTATPTPSYGGGGILGSIICTELYRQNKLTLKELVGCREFGEKLPDETYFGYLTIAKHIVKLMKRSDKFSNLFIGWAKSISRKEPNAITRFMLPICNLIGKLNVKRFLYAR